MNRLLLIATGVCAFALHAASVAASPLTFALTVDHCSTGCGAASYGRVDVSQFAANDVLVDVMLASNVAYVGTGFPGSFAFDLVDPDPTIAVSFDTPSTGWSLLNTTAGSYHFNGFGDLEYVLLCNICDGGSNPQAVALRFHVTAPGLTPIAFLELSTAKSGPAYFVADVRGPNGLTGTVGAVPCEGRCDGVSQQAVVPEPASLTLLGTGLAAFARFGRRRCGGTS